MPVQRVSRGGEAERRVWKVTGGGEKSVGLRLPDTQHNYSEVFFGFGFFR